MPFIEPVLRQVEPFMDSMLVTVSEKSTDGTREVLAKLQSEWKGKLVVDTENVKRPGELTKERQKQLDRTPRGAWVLFLDSDDWWPEDSLESIDMFLKPDVDGLSVCPYQVFNEKYHDSSWKNRWFTKWFRNDEGVHYQGDWPRDMIYKGKNILYWRRNDKAPRVAVRFFHLANLMDWRFRDLPEFAEYKGRLGSLIPYDKGWEDDLEKIFSYVRRD